MTTETTDLKEILKARSKVPHDFLGMHKTAKGVVVRAFVINAATCEVVDVNDDMASRYKMKKLDEAGLYEAEIPKRGIFAYRLRTTTYAGEVRQFYDPYSFLPTLSDDDLYLIGKGDEHRIYDKLGSHVKNYGGIKGTAFAVWAPTARRVSLVGNFNEWDGRY
ncbi:MAG: 1,4-alpha-glucan branching enzyme, partial [Opitutales bacterium]|nr:1,4-alpha-glucan branching enzyme [Opitutales bacterium]